MSPISQRHGPKRMWRLLMRAIHKRGREGWKNHLLCFYLLFISILGKAMI
jgi:hypothetical protein